MTEAGWTRERPTKNGWYWWRFDASTSATIVRIMVCGDGSLAEMSNNGHLLLAANFDGEWLGPITPTDRQQGRVEGLRDSMDDLRKRMDRDDGDTDNDVWKHLAWCELQIKAQAAQDEKPTKEGL